METTNPLPEETLEHSDWGTPAHVYTRLEAMLAAPHLAAYRVDTPDGRSQIWYVHDPSGRLTGTYLRSSRTSTGEDGSPVEHVTLDRISRFFAWRPTRITSVRPDAGGHLVPEGGHQTQFHAEWVEQSRELLTSEPIAGAVATSVSKLKDLLGATAGLPLQRPQEKMLDNSLTLAGIESQTEIRRLMQPGWMYAAGRWVFAAPQGSIDSAGTTSSEVPLSATGLPAQDAGADLAGWGRTLDSGDLRTAAPALAEFVALARTRSTTLMMLLLMFAAPLQLTVRSGAIVKAKPGSGKSLLLTRLAHFVAPADGRAPRYLLSIPESSKAGISALMGWARGLVLMADDLRSQNVSADRVAVMQGVVEQAAQMAYGAGVSTKANPDGTLRNSARRSEATVIISGEELHGAAAISGRLNTLFIGKGDVATEMINGTAPPVDVWRAKYGTTGLANGLYADYLAWLAGRMDSNGANGLVLHRQRFDQVAAEFTNSGLGGREREVVGPAYAAWTAISEWATDRGFAGLLPDAGEVARLLNTQQVTNLEITEEVSDSREFLARVREALESRRGHFETQDGAVPGHAERLGWVRDDHQWTSRDGTTPPKLLRSRRLLGLLSADGAHVTITSDGMRHIWAVDMKRTGRFRRDDLEDQLEDYVPVDARGKKKVPTRYVNGGNTVGIVLDIGLAFPGLIPALATTTVRDSHSAPARDDTKPDPTPF